MTETAPSINQLLQRAVIAYKKRFNNHPPITGAVAPGRVNLIGEHTDYNLGYVLPVAIDRWVVAVAGGGDTQSTILALDIEDEITVDFSNEVCAVDDKIWANYPLGVVHIFQKNGIVLPNVNMVITSSVPIGSGLSSSAAAEVAVATVLEQVAGISALDPVQKAKWCREAEHAFPGVPCGIMDQMISTLARKDCGLLIDCKTGGYDYVSLPSSQEVVLLIANTNVKHRLAATEYSLRRDQCDSAVKQIRQSGIKAYKNVKSLRDLSIADLPEVRDNLEPVLYARALHVVKENDRALRAVDALRSKDLSTMGQLMYASHVSLRDNYAVSCAELDYLVDLTHNFSLENPKYGKQPDSGSGVYGSRMTGAGFGGCTITLCKPEIVDELTAYMKSNYYLHFGREPAVFITRAVKGTHAVALDKLY